MSILERTTKHNGERYEVGLLWADDNPYLAYQQFLLMETKLDKDFELKNAHQATIENDLECNFVRKLDQKEIDNTEKY